MDKSTLDAIRRQMIETKNLQEQSLQRLKEIKSKAEVSMDPTELKEINKAIKMFEKSLKLYADL